MKLDKHRIISDDERYDPASTALIVVDVQNYFCHPDGPSGSADLSMVPDMVRGLTALVDAAREAGMLIVWVRSTYESLYQGPPLAEAMKRIGRPAERCVEGSWEADWFAPLAPRDAPNEVVVTKHRYSAFWDSPIDLCLRSNGITSVVLGGIVTSGCVESTARDAFFLNYYITLVDDACASYSRERHRNALAKLATTFGLVGDSATLAARWNAAAPGPRNWELSEKQKLVPSGDALVEPGNTALVIIDMQNDFCHPDGKMGRLGEGLTHNRSIIAPIARLIAAARAAGVMIVHVQGRYGPTTGSPVSLFKKGTVSLDICLPGSWGARQVDELAPAAGEPVVIKHRLSAFRDTCLDLLLRSNGIANLVVVGTATQACVESSVREGHLRDYRIVVVEDAVAARDRMRHLHEASLEVMGEYFATLMQADAVAEIWIRETAEVRAHAS